MIDTKSLREIGLVSDKTNRLYVVTDINPNGELIINKEVDAWLLSKLNYIQSVTEKRLREMVNWSTGTDTGASSKCIIRFMNGLQTSVSGWYYNSPMDSADRGRCIRLLNLFPEWWDRLDEMRFLSKEWNEQIDLILKERYSLTQEKE